jgi:energy-coupling factor transporter ATP-binding protein EcfA2
VIQSSGPGRQRKRYSVSRIRLINFHNFVNETIDIRDGGHLFLLGDNGAGKTTVLDALHYALSGGQELELNAAARIGGRRDEGRSIQGIVLRSNAGKGEINPPSSIAYAVVELLEQEGSERFCFGVGTQATTLDARVTRWALLHRGAIETLALLRNDGGGDRPATRDELRETLGRIDTFLGMAEYRKALAERLFDGAAPYDDVCRFWGMAKAYREIVAGARDFDTLFARLLPAPDTEVFSDILKSMREIDELEVALRELTLQRGYVSALVDLTAEVARHREAAARYRWLGIHFEAIDEDEAIAQQRTVLDNAEREGLEAEARVEERRRRLAAADETLAAARSADKDGILVSLQQANVDLAARRAEADKASTAAKRAASERARAEAARTSARRGLQSSVGSALSQLGALAEQDPAVAEPVARLLGEWREVEAALAADSELPTDLPTLTQAEDRRLDRERTRADVARRDADRRQQSAQDQRERAAARATSLRGVHEEAPQVRGFAEAIAALAADGHEVTPIYQAISPSPGAPPERLAALEALVGDDVLAALLVPTPDVERARRTLTKVDTNARVVARVADEVSVPAWVDGLLEPATGPLDAAARGVIASALAQPISLGLVEVPTAPGDVELRGLAFRVVARSPRLLGVEARRSAHAERLRLAEEELASARRGAEAVAAEVASLERRLDGLSRASDAFDTFMGDAFRRSELDVRLAERDAIRADSHAEATASAREEAQARLSEKEKLVEVLNARAADRGLHDLQSRIATLDADRRVAQAEVEAATSARALAVDAQRRSREIIAERERQRGEISQRLLEAGAELKAHPGVPAEEGGLERYVLITQRGSTFRTRAAVTHRLDEARDAEGKAIAELHGDGSRGVRCLQYAGQFGFSYDAGANRLEDRRQQAAPGVLAELDRNIVEQGEVVGERTREMMDKLVMGQLARHVREQVEQLTRTVKDINRLLERLRFGTTRYQFSVVPKPERRELVELIRSLSLLDESKRAAFRAFIDERLAELKGADDEAVPELLDYRKWFDYRLKMGSGDGIELTRELRVLGSGGEQGVPNYLLVLALAKLMFDNANARVRPLMFDEAFYGIDAGRRDELLRFATELGLQLVVASPDQDGATTAVRYATTLFVVKDDNCDIHLAPHHFWNHESEVQTTLFAERKATPAEEAVCRQGEE